MTKGTDYLNWIKDKVNSVLGQEPKLYPDFNVENALWMVLLLDNISSKGFSNRSNEVTYTYSLQIGYLYVKGDNLASLDNQFTENIEKVFNEFKKIENRHIGITSGDLLQSVSLNINLERKGGMILRLGEIKIDIKLVI